MGSDASSKTNAGSTGSADTRAGPLAGVRILDMATVLAAPFGATLCADWGADVIKLELPDGSDPLRGLLPVHEGVPLYWKVVNRGKKGISLDVRKPAGRELLLKLVAGIDVLVENFRPGTMDRWGLDIGTLHAVNPRLVVLRLTGFGQSGPLRDKPGFARVFEAMSGFANLSGEAGGSPLHMNYPAGDVIAGAFAAFAISSAMVRMRGDPRAPGFEIDLSATEALFRMLDPLPVEYEVQGVVRGPAGNRATYTSPSNMYRTRDGAWVSLVASGDPVIVHGLGLAADRDGAWVSLVASSNPVFVRLAKALGRPALAQDPLYSSMAARIANMEPLDRLIHDWFASHEFAEVAQALDGCAVPFARVQSIAEIVHDPQFAARSAIVRLPDPDAGSLPAPCIVPRIIGETLPLPRTGPAVGEHNDEVYGALGVDGATLDALRQDGVI